MELPLCCQETLPSCCDSSHDICTGLCTASCLEAFASSSARLFATCTVNPFIEIPELRVGSPQRSLLFLNFVFHTTNVLPQKKLSKLKVWHSSHGPKQNAGAHVYLDISRMVVTTTNSVHKPKDTELETKNKSPLFKPLFFTLHLCLPLFGVDSMFRLNTT